MLAGCDHHDSFVHYKPRAVSVSSIPIINSATVRTLRHPEPIWSASGTVSQYLWSSVFLIFTDSDSNFNLHPSYFVHQPTACSWGVRIFYEKSPDGYGSWIRNFCHHFAKSIVLELAPISPTCLPQNLHFQIIETSWMRCLEKHYQNPTHDGDTKVSNRYMYFWAGISREIF